MIFDADAHLTTTGEGILVDELLRKMDKCGVDKSIIWLQPPYMRYIDEGNKYIYDSMKTHSDRLYGIGWVDPHLGRQQSIDMIKRCYEEYGLYGMKLNGAQNTFYIDSENLAMPLIDEIAKYNKPLALHIGADAYDTTHPFRLGKIADKYPELPILMVHMGGVSIPSLANAAIEIAAEHKNITLIGSASQYTAILRAIKTLGADRVCYGSDTPFFLMRVEVAAWNAMLEGEVTQEEKDKLMGGNIARVLNIAINSTIIEASHLK